MNLSISVLSLKSETLPDSLVAHFDAAGGTIGRADTSTLVLPDPDRHISRGQAEVRMEGGRFSIRNVGSANAMAVNGRLLQPGESHRLAEGDMLQVGAYLMRASFLLPRPPKAPPSIDTATTGVHVRQPRGATRATAPGRVAKTVAPFPAPVMRAPAPAKNLANAPSVLRRDEPKVDTVPGLRQRQQAFDSSGPAPLDALERNDEPAPDDALWQAFCEGAGISLMAPQDLGPELMRTIGEILNGFVDGSLQLAALRTALRQAEHGEDATLVQPRHHNPLKFSPDAGTAIEELLRPPTPGLVVGAEAVHEVMDELFRAVQEPRHRPDAARSTATRDAD